ncbi:MAG: nitrogen regulation protein NR(II) [Desulfovibrionaceae bacterium]
MIKFKRDNKRPFKLVKFLSWSFFALILGFSLTLSVFVSNFAQEVLLAKERQFALLLAENVNHQVYRRFMLPTLVGFGRINLSSKTQYARLDQTITSTLHSFHPLDVRIYGPDNQITYSSDPAMVGKTGLAGEFVKRAFEHGEHSFKIIRSVSSLLAFFKVSLSPESVVMQTIYPLRAERSPTFPVTGEPIIGVLMFTQDITKDYGAVITFSRLVVATSSLGALVLFLIMLMVLRRADRMNMEQARERERLERHLMQQEKLAGMGRMVAGVAHEIRNPLGIIRSSAELLLGKARKDNWGNTKILAAIVEESRRLSRIVTDFLDYARPKQPKQSVVDVSNLLTQAAFLLSRDEASGGCEIRQEYPGDLDVEGDKDLLYRAFYNIIVNALQAMGSEGVLTIRGEQDKTTLRLSFLDTGPGFDPASRDKIMDPFFTTKDTGTGLGLAIVKNILDSHHAGMELGDNPGGGARVDLTIPRKPGALDSV